MDGDLQDAPEVIPSFLEKLEQGYDVVYATRASRKESLGLRLCYYLFYRLQAALSDISLPIDAGDFGDVPSRRGTGAENAGASSLPARAAKLGWIQADWRSHRAGGAGGGKEQIWLFSPPQACLRRYLRIFRWPLRAATLVGAAAAGLSGIFAVYSIYAKFVMHKSPQGFTALVLLISFLSGVLLFFQGIIGEYLGRVYEELKGRPIYVIDEIIHHAAPPPQN